MGTKTDRPAHTAQAWEVKQAMLPWIEENAPLLGPGEDRKD